MPNYMFAVRIVFFLKCLYLKGHVDNTIARDEVLNSYSDLKEVACRYLQSLHQLKQSEVQWISEVSKHNCDIITRFEKEFFGVSDLSRYRQKVQ